MSNYATPGWRVSQKRRAERRTYLAEETQYLLDYRATPEEICRKLNTTPSALARLLYREGYRQEAAPIERLAKRLWRENRQQATSP